MIKIISKNRFLILRRFTQILLMFLYIAGNVWAWQILQGNLSSSMFLGFIPLSDPFAVLQMLFAGAILTLDILIGAFIIAIFYAITGRVFCSWICPVNIITDCANYVRRKLRMNQIEKKQPASRKIRYYVLALSLILSAILGVTAFEFISPVSITHRAIIFGVGMAWTMLLVIFLFDLFILKNGWCGHICPLGGFYALIGRFRLLKIDYDMPKCTDCMKCKEICPENQVLWMIGKQNIPILSAECTNCGRCVEVCDDDALHFSLKTQIGDKK